MRVYRGRRRLPLLPAAVVLVAAGAIVAIVLVVSSSSSGGGTGSSQRRMASIFQDDQYLLYSDTATTTRTLQTLVRLGADTIRVQVLWAAIAPDAKSATPPAGFAAGNPSAYPAAGWAPYDRLVRLAAAYHLTVNFDLTAPGPLWAMRQPAPDARTADHYAPAVAQLQRFVHALGRRYSGTYTPPGSAQGPLPRVSSWSIWNEPNQPGWLAPQWRYFGGTRVLDSPRLYREYLDAAFSALRATGHAPGRDTMLIGELAPEGCSTTSGPGCSYSPEEEPVTPMRFIRGLYCLGSDYRPLRGLTAVALHCPPAGNTRAFVREHPGLFDATGFAHHPYSFFFAPSVSLTADPDFVPLADLSRLERGLDRIFATYGVSRRLPIYITEYGYDTNPPNPRQVFSPSQQAAFIDQAQYMAWRDPRVRSMAQFLLFDSRPDPAFPPGSVGYWSTFQTGLLYADGRPKPSLAAYRLPLFIPRATFKPGASVLVWGMLRADHSGARQSAQIQWRGAGGGFRTIATVTTDNPSGFLTASVKLPGSGSVRLRWAAPAQGAIYSRVAPVRES